MEKTKKVNLTTILLVIAIIIIVVLGAVAFIFYKDKSDAESRLNTLTSQVSGLENIVTGLREEQSKAQESSNKANNKTNASNNVKGDENDKLDETEVKDALETVLKLYGETTSFPDDILKSLKLGDPSDLDTSNEKEIDGGFYKNANVKYSDYKKAMCKYVSEECFEKNFTENYREVDGLLYIRDGFGSADEYEIDSVTNEEGNNYVANLCWINKDGNRSTKFILNFSIDDDYVITSFDMIRK